MCPEAIFSKPLRTLDDRTAFLAPVGSSTFIRGFQGIEIEIAFARSVEALWTTVVSQFLGANRQMAMLAPERAFSRRQKLQRRMRTRCHALESSARILNLTTAAARTKSKTPRR
jgi:hypothetical protein